MNYKNGQLFIENISVKKIEKKFKSPAYVYSLKQLKNNIFNFKKEFKSINPLICFSVKSNSNLEILKVIKSYGLGADVVSLGEMLIALKAGIKKDKIVFSGVGKTFEELNFAINKNILLINTESEDEIKDIEKIAMKKGKKVNIGVRLNPDTDAKTLSKISTGKKEDKFGLNKNQILKILEIYKQSKYINITCLSVHIGSQITSHKPYEKMINVIDSLINRSKYKFKYIDLGGGMGIKYSKKDKNLNYNKYLKKIKIFLKDKDSKIIFEPGRVIIGNSGFILSKVIYVKNTSKKNFIIIDTAMNDLLRPALYGAKHKILVAKKSKKYIEKNHEFVGPICETSDKFLNINKFQMLKKGDLLVICDVGAYGMVLSSNYNMRPKIPEILVSGSKTKIIRKRQKLQELI